MKSDALLLQFLMEKVMGWHAEQCSARLGVYNYSEHGSLRTGGWRCTLYPNGAVEGWNPLQRNQQKAWGDAGMLWEKATKKGTFALSMNADGVIAWADHPAISVSGDSGPRALSLAIARAFGYEGATALDAAEKGGAG